MLLCLRHVGDIDKLLQNGVTVGLETLSPGERAALLGLWRGRDAYERKEAEKRRLEAERRAKGHQ